MTQLEALKIAHEELSSMIPYKGYNDYIFKASDVIEKMIRTKEKKLHAKMELQHVKELEEYNG